MIEQQYIPYWEWEDFINGMWRRLDKEDEPRMIKLAVDFTGDHNKYGNAMRDVIFAWPRTMINSLTNKNINRRAFLGHCAVQYKINCPEYIVRIAWKMLTDYQRKMADMVAQENINIYERENIGLHKNVGTKMLF